MTPLLHALASAPDTSDLNLVQISSTHFANILFAHLLRSSPKAKSFARLIKPGSVQPYANADSGQFFVPADGASPPTVQQTVPDEDEPPQTLLQLLSENLSLALLARSRPDTSDREIREWDRVAVGYLSLISQWLWEDPKSVRDFLDGGGLGTVSSLPYPPLKHASPPLV
jgi:hypothetical protein